MVTITTKLETASNETFIDSPEDCKEILPKEIILDSPLRQDIIPCVIDKAEFTIYTEREPGEVQISKCMRIHQLLGDPEVIPADMLDDVKLTEELERLNSIMKSHEIFVKNFTEISDREIYRFITEEFFNKEIAGKSFLRPLRMIYEEFYPTDEYLIRKQTSDFLRSLFGYEMWKYSWKRWKGVLTNYKEIKSFALEYQYFDDIDIVFNRISIEEHTATIFFDTKFVAVHSDGFFITRFEGPGEGKLFRTNNGGWCLGEIMLPGKVK